MLERDEKIHIEIISAVSGKSAEEVFHWMNSERFLFSKDALNEGLSTRFVTPQELLMPDSYIIANK
jgi:ATP-dependent protease ClpP protease subunit